MGNKHTPRLKDRFFGLLQLPEEMVGNESFIYYRIGGELCINGCGEILKYENNEIKLKTIRGDATVSIVGDMLTMKTYYQKDMIIKGVITEIKIE